VEALLGAEADLDVVDGEDETALELAASMWGDHPERCDAPDSMDIVSIMLVLLEAVTS